MFYSLADAAKAVNRTKPALLNAIQKGRISAKKNALGQWEIDPAELHRVYPLVNQLPQNAEPCLTDLIQEKNAQIRELQARLEAAEERKNEIQARNEELKQERDDWKQQADEWRMQAKALPVGEETPKRGFWARLIGR
jgi:uncharacterized coiled-coil DUF342 family protein